MGTALALAVALVSAATTVASAQDDGTAIATKPVRTARLIRRPAVSTTPDATGVEAAASSADKEEPSPSSLRPLRFVHYTDPRTGHTAARDGDIDSPFYWYALDQESASGSTKRVERETAVDMLLEDELESDAAWRELLFDDRGMSMSMPMSTTGAAPASIIEDTEDGARAQVLGFLKQSFAPITSLSVVYGEEMKCPIGLETLSQVEPNGDTNGEINDDALLSMDFNAGTNGKVVKLCYGRDPASGSPISQVDFVTRRRGVPQCPSGWQPVLVSGTSVTADLNKDASVTWLGFITVRLQITMCFRRSPRAPLYFFRLLSSESYTPREFSAHPQNLNQDVSLKQLYLATSASSSMFAAAAALAGESNEPRGVLSWATAVEDTATGDITVTARIHCQKDGGIDAAACLVQSIIQKGVEWTKLDATEFKKLCRLTQEGMEFYWSGFITLHGKTRNFKLRVVETDTEPNKDADICLNTGDEFARSLNPNFDVIDLTIWYNKKFDSDGWVRYISAHELGHSPLYEYGGLTHSWGHKGTSTILGETTDDTPICPNVDVDLMKYCLGGFDVADVKSTNWDKAKWLMTAGSYQMK